VHQARRQPRGVPAKLPSIRREKSSETASSSTAMNRNIPKARTTFITRRIGFPWVETHWRRNVGGMRSLMIMSCGGSAEQLRCRARRPHQSAGKPRSRWQPKGISRTLKHVVWTPRPSSPIALALTSSSKIAPRPTWKM